MIWLKGILANPEVGCEIIVWGPWAGGVSADGPVDLPDVLPGLRILVLLPLDHQAVQPLPQGA